MRGTYHPSLLRSKGARAHCGLSEAEQVGAIRAAKAAGWRRTAEQAQRQANQAEAHGRVFFAPGHRQRAAIARRELRLQLSQSHAASPALA